MKALQRDYDAILADAMEAGAGMAREAHRVAIDNMEKRAPEMFARLNEELAAFTQ